MSEIDAVRAKIAEMRKWAEYVRRYWVNVSGVSKTLDTAANALEAVMDLCRTRLLTAGDIKAALTRAITIGEQ